MWYFFSIIDLNIGPDHMRLILPVLTIIESNSLFFESQITFKTANRSTRTGKPVNKGHSIERHNLVFIGKWSLFGGYYGLFYQGMSIEVWPLFTGWSLFRGGL